MNIIESSDKMLVCLKESIQRIDAVEKSAVRGVKIIFISMVLLKIEIRICF